MKSYMLLFSVSIFQLLGMNPEKYPEGIQSINRQMKALRIQTQASQQEPSHSHKIILNESDKMLAIAMQQAVIFQVQ